MSDSFVVLNLFNKLDGCTTNVLVSDNLILLDQNSDTQNIDGDEPPYLLLSSH